MATISGRLATGCVVGLVTCSLATTAMTRQAIPARTGTDQTSVVAGIEGSARVHALLQRIRQAIGGFDRLSTVNSLLVEGTRNTSREVPFTYRILLPDRFQRVTPTTTFTVNGSAAYWQHPDPGSAVTALSGPRTAALFAEQCLLLLMRAPSQVPLRASLPRPTTPGALEVYFTGPSDFASLVTIDPQTFRIKSYIRPMSVSGHACTDDGPVSFDLGKGEIRYAIGEYREVAGLWFPVQLTQYLVGGGPTESATIRLTSIRVNEGVTATDFNQR